MATGKPNLTDHRYAETVAPRDDDGFSKAQHDIAVAALVLQTGLLSERQLSSALATWTIHGSVPLPNHLAAQGLLDETARRQLMEQAAERLESCGQANARPGGAASESVVLSTLDAIDGSGTVARLLGIRAVAGAGAVDATGMRQATIRYRLVRKLGQGGLGRVWLALDQDLKRHVAVKEIAAADNTAAVERFRREAEITGRLEHPGIVPVYQLAEDSQTGQVFYAMRFLGKQTMHDSILQFHERRCEGDDNCMLIRRLLTDFVSVCQAIGHAHSRKVIHRDLKPENIAIDSFGQVIVIDWGIAKVIDDVGLGDNLADPFAGAGGDQSTMDGQVLGTPLYMAPEQAAGRIDELDERTDIYGLGAILYAILTGYAPHEQTRDTSSASGVRDLLSAIASHGTPDPVAANPDVCPSLGAICMKAMARRQYARYQTASELAEDVQRWMAGEPVSAYQEKPLQRAARWIRNHRVWSQVIAAAAIVGLVTLITLGLAARQNRIATRQVLFDEMRSYEREIEVQLTGTAAELAKDARFMSILPPIQGMIDSRAGLPDAESEEVWHGRLETIYEGLLRANPDYLAISYTAATAEGQGTNLVRVERNASDASYVRRVPATRLGAFSDGELLKKATALLPGETLLTIRRQASSADATRKYVSLVASTPVYDETTGSLFGVVSVETNLLKRLVTVVETIEQRSAAIYLTDSAGQVWVSDDPDVGVEMVIRDIKAAELIPGTAQLFEGEDHRRRIDRDEGWIASRVPLDPASPQTAVGVVIRLEDAP